MDLAAAELTGHSYPISVTDLQEWEGTVSIQGTTIAGTLRTATGAVRQISGDTREWHADFEDRLVELFAGAPVVTGLVAMYIGTDRLHVRFRNEKAGVAGMVNSRDQRTRVEVRCPQLLRALSNGMSRLR